MIIALVGRRIDSPESNPARFPLQNVPLVQTRLRSLFQGYPGATLVCSAACGADLLALDAAGSAAWRRRVILPFDRRLFRETSVTDRPGDWGDMYDRILDEVERSGDVVTLSAVRRDTSFEQASDRILEEAFTLAACGEKPAAVVVWDGADRGPGDLTRHFEKQARGRGLDVLHVSTLD